MIKYYLDIKYYIYIYYNILGTYSEDCKLAAASSLGQITVGNMNYYLPILLQYIPTTTNTTNNSMIVEPMKHQYLLIISIKEILSVYLNQNKDFICYLHYIQSILAIQCLNTEESVRTVVSECYGLLTCLLGRSRYINYEK